MFLFEVNSYYPNAIYHYVIAWGMEMPAEKAALFPPGAYS